MASLFKGQYVDSIIQNVRRHGEKIFEQKPEDAVQKVVQAVDQAGFAVKMIMKSKWKDIEAVITDVDGVLKEVEKRDPEVHAVLVKHIDWVNSFSNLLKEELKKHLFGK